MYDFYGEVRFSQKIFTNFLNIDLPLSAKFKKTVHEVDEHWLSGKEKVLGASFSKEGRC